MLHYDYEVVQDIHIYIYDIRLYLVYLDMIE